MKRTSAVLGKVALAASLGIAASPAHAVPIVFDFSGTVTGVTGGNSVIGQSVLGRFVVETDGLVARTETYASGTSVSYNDFPADPVDLITSQVTIGDIAYEVGVYGSNQSALSAFDSSGLPPCAGCSIASDAVELHDWSMGYWPLDGSGPAPAPGMYPGLRLILRWDSAALDFIDLSNGFEPLGLLSTLTTLLPSGIFSEETYNCAGRACYPGVGDLRTDFRVDSLTIHTPSIPEPGTLALFAVGLLGGAVARRSTAKAR
jgi:hypothetical protein